jgi:hypothetical protein
MAATAPVRLPLHDDAGDMDYFLVTDHNPGRIRIHVVAHRES